MFSLCSSRSPFVLTSVHVLFMVCSTNVLVGESYNIYKNYWSIAPDMSVNRSIYINKKTINNQIVQHAIGLFDTILQRAEKTDIRFTPYMQKILSNENVDSKTVNQIIINDLKNNIRFLNTAKSPEAY